MNRNRPQRNLTIAPLEALDQRIVPASGGGISSLPVAAQEAFVTNRGGQALGSIYTQYVNYEEAGAKGAFTSSFSKQIYISGTSVGLDIKFVGGDYNTLLGQLKGIGMQFTATSPQNGLVEGYLPLSELPILASNGYAATITPVYQPTFSSDGTSAPTVDEAHVTNRAGQALGSIYTQYVNYEEAGAKGTFTSSFASQIEISGTSVGVDITFNGGDFDTLVGQLKGIGMQVTAISTQSHTVEGYLPIGQLPVVANNGYATNISPIYKPSLG